MTSSQSPAPGRRSVPVVCQQIAAIGSVAQTVCFAEKIEDRKPQWAFIFPSDHGFVIGKRYEIHIHEPGGEL